jgi:hypothetical protein
MVKDAGYWMNYLAVERLSRCQAATFSAAVEESALGERVAALNSNGPGLFPHGDWIRSRFDPGGGQDLMVLSIGGNDVALKPSTSTIASISS